MIFVTVGTNETRFDRLVRSVAPLTGDEEVVVQHGPSPVRPPGAMCVDYLSFEEMVDHIRRATVVVTHAGVGSVLAALANGVRPIVVPRLHRLGEAVDDHQLSFGRRLHADGLVELVEDPDRLADSVRAHDGSFLGAVGTGGKLVADLRQFIVSSTAGARGR